MLLPTTAEQLTAKGAEDAAAAAEAVVVNGTVVVVLAVIIGVEPVVIGVVVAVAVAIGVGPPRLELLAAMVDNGRPDGAAEMVVIVPAATCSAGTPGATTGIAAARENSLNLPGTTANDDAMLPEPPT